MQNGSVKHQPGTIPIIQLLCTRGPHITTMGSHAYPYSFGAYGDPQITRHYGDPHPQFTSNMGMGDFVSILTYNNNCFDLSNFYQEIISAR